MNTKKCVTFFSNYIYIYIVSCIIKNCIRVFNNFVKKKNASNLNFDDIFTEYQQIQIFKEIVIFKNRF